MNQILFITTWKINIRILILHQCNPLEAELHLKYISRMREKTKIILLEKMLGITKKWTRRLLQSLQLDGNALYLIIGPEINYGVWMS